VVSISIPFVTSKNLRLRILSSLVLAPITLGAVWFGGWFYDFAVLAVGIQALREWVLLIDPPHRPTLASYRIKTVFFLALIVIIGLGIAVSLSIAILTIAIFSAALFLRVGRAERLRALWFAGGLPYIAGGCLALIYLRGLYPFGQGILFFLLATVWGTDIGAYFTGRTLGGPKLAPVISPNKTWSGLCGGMVLAALLGYGVARFMSLPHQTASAVLAAIMAIVAQTGDLFESVAKRQSGVKESGHLIPGHGGILDRIDGLVFAAIFLAILTAAAHGLGQNG
jgi:phosphatidate cytidylyltransferase